MTEESQQPQGPQGPSKPSDVDVFLGLLPAIVGSFAQKHQEAPTAAGLAINLAREATGQLASLGVCDVTTRCRDGFALALIGGAPAASPSEIPQNFGQTLGNGQSRMGAMVAQFKSEDVRRIQGL
jgi:hypothetical protein